MRQITKNPHPIVWFRRFVMLIMVSLLLIACKNNSQDDNSLRYRSEIRYTQFGIPHIKADDWGSLGYGYGYSFAADNLCVLAEELVTINGERSLFFGPDAGYQDPLNLAVESVIINNLKSDFFFTLMMTPERLAALRDATPLPFQKLVQGYVAGYNRYLRDTGIDALPTPCRGAAWVRHIELDDLYRLFYGLTLLQSSRQFIDAFVNATPPGTETMSVETFRARTPIAMPDMAVPGLGSNAYALGREVTENGRGMLLGNPHFPWLGNLRFYQVHLTLPGELDVMGASLYGTPFVQIGFNHNLAWTHTVSRAWRFTLYRLTLEPGNPTAYRYGDIIRALTPKTVSVQIREPDGSLGERRHTFYLSHLGPVVSNTPRLPFSFWSTDTAYVLRDANAENFRTLAQWLRLNQATSLESFRQALNEIVGIPWANTLAVDPAGSAFYGDITVVPNVPDSLAARCINTDLAMLVFANQGLPILDGADPGCEWIVDPAAPQAGIFAATALPALARNDYIANSNDSYWLSNPEQPLTGFPRIVGDEETPRSLRTRLALTQIRERLNGQDGLPGMTFSLPHLQTILFANRNYGGELLAGDLSSVCAMHPTVVLEDGMEVALGQACEILANWDRKNNIESFGAQVFRAFWERATTIENLFEIPFNPTAPLDTPNGLNIDNPQVLTRIRQALGEAVRDLANQSIPLDAAWGEVHALVRDSIVVPIHGGNGTEGVFNSVNARRYLGSAGDLPAYDPVYGSSYIQTVTFDGNGPVAEVLLTYSQSSDPDSPHFADQTRLYSRKEWVRLPFSETEIAADPGLKIVVLEELEE